MPTIALITQHQKAQWIAPSLLPLGFEVIECELFNTDSLGTFAGDIERTLTPKDAALTKAKKACELTCFDWGLGSEGSFGGGPAPGMINWNSEILCLYQASTGVIVYAHAEGPTAVQTLSLNGKTPLPQQLLRLPGQHWILRTEKAVYKGLNAEQLLVQLQDSEVSKQALTIEPDLRAMFSPQRQQMITKAADDLVRRLSETCPNCQAFNFVIKEKQAGLPCTLCSLPTEQAKAWTQICDDCGHRSDKVVDAQGADPSHCQFCNP